MTTSRQQKNQKLSFTSVEQPRRCWTTKAAPESERMAAVCSAVQVQHGRHHLRITTRPQSKATSDTMQTTSQACQQVVWCQKLPHLHRHHPPGSGCKHSRTRRENPAALHHGCCASLSPRAEAFRSGSIKMVKHQHRADDAPLTLCKQHFHLTLRRRHKNFPQLVDSQLWRK